MDRFKATLLAIFLFISLPSFSANFDKVIGGRDTTNREHPWQVGLHTRYSGHLCGASLVGKRIILTAAHCVDTFGAKDLRIKAASPTGEMRLLKRLPRVEKVVIHPKFNPKNLASNDIAVIILKRDVSYSDELKPIDVIRPSTFSDTLENNFRNLPGRLISTGWGTKEPPSRIPIHSKILQEVDVKPIGVTKTDLLDINFREMLISDFNMSEEIINFIQANDSNVLLTTGEIPQTGNCLGDSGGPLVYYEEGKAPLLIGITSYAVGGEKLCKGLAGFTNIQSHAEWLKPYFDMM